MKKCFPLLFLLIFSLACKSTKESTTAETKEPKTEKVKPSKFTTSRIAFYNVENLFDLEDDLEKLDEDFTPEGKQKWTAERYQAKLEKISVVLDSLNYPSFVGLCEVENETVLKDLIDHKNLKKPGYDFEHFESPDIRGIDVALLYKKSDFKVIRSLRVPVIIPDKVEKDYTTRDILYVKGTFQKKHVLHIFVNHWPSRRGGIEASEPKRVIAAQHLRHKVDSLFRINDLTNIIIMGDFNDETSNKSIATTLRSMDTIPDARSHNLMNLAASLDKENKGSYNYRGEWNMLDQIMVSPSLSKESGVLSASFQKIFDADWLMFQDEKFGPRPNRTYGGLNYYGGYSDHLPVFVDLKVRKE